jgi:ribosomal silencing factor RsfS
LLIKQEKKHRKKSEAKLQGITTLSKTKWVNILSEKVFVHCLHQTENMFFNLTLVIEQSPRIHKYFADVK